MRFYIILLYLLGSISFGLDLSLQEVGDHINGEKNLTAESLKGIEAEIVKGAEVFDGDQALLKKAFDVIKNYEEKHGALFLNDKIQKPFSRSKYEGIELERVIFALQQALIDYAYNAEDIGGNPKLYGFKFETSEYFPGACDPSKSPQKTLSVEINASQRKAYGYPLNEDEEVARRPTGWYLPPGEVVKLSVPPELVGTGYNIRVGAHSWDLEKRPVVARLNRVSIVYPIEEKQFSITHPLGGGIYLEVPWEADEGVVKLHARNAVESPFFHSRLQDKGEGISLKKELAKNAPWTDFETDKFMMQIPTVWAKEIKDPETVLREYDKCMDLFSEIVGRPSLRSKVILYMQVDIIFRGAAFFPGYPQSNFKWNPHSPEIRKSQRWVIEGAHKAPSVLFHEMGHGQRFSKFKGGTEAVVNFPYVYVHNKGYDTELDLAFSKSFANRSQLTVDEAAINRMVTENFRNGRPVNVTNKPGDEVKYQHRGYAVYADIAKLFGWEPLVQFWTEDQENYIAGADFNFIKGRKFPANINNDPTDKRILRLSITAGVDLTPLAHFWGRQPEDPEKLKKAIEKHKLKPSSAIYDRLNHYKGLIPMSRSEFLRHAKIMSPKCEKEGVGAINTNPLFGHGWYHLWLDKYDREHGEKANLALQSIIEQYFPNGRPK